MFRLIYAYFDRLGVELDVLINVLLGGNLGETVSMRCALASRSKKWWGCYMCEILHVIIEKDHCAKQFDDSPRVPLTVLRAGFAFGVVIYCLYLLLLFIRHTPLS